MFYVFFQKHAAREEKCETSQIHRYLQNQRTIILEIGFITSLNCMHSVFYIILLSNEIVLPFDVLKNYK